MGNLNDLNTRHMRRFFTEAHRDLGPVFGIRALGLRWTVLAGLEANRLVAGPGRRSFASADAWGPLDRHFGVRNSMISVDGPEHRVFRRVEGNAYTRAHFLATLDRSVAIARQDVAGLPTGWFDVAPWCKRLVTEQVAQVAIGATVRPLLDDLVPYVQNALMATVTRQRPTAVLRTPRLRRAQQRTWAVVDDLIATRRRTGPVDPPDLIDDLLAAEASDPGRWAPEDLRQATLGAFVAGMDTAANTLAFALYELGRRPDLAAQLTAETDAAFADGVTPESLQKLTGVMRFVFEVLRMYPIAPAAERTVVQPVELGGHTVPAGTRVIVATTVTHGLPELFADPDRFDPGRFDDERAEHRTPGAYVPFGVGTHTCAGRGMAEGLLVLDVALFCHLVRFSGDPGYRLKQVARPTPSPDGRLRLAVWGRR